MSYRPQKNNLNNNSFDSLKKKNIIKQTGKNKPAIAARDLFISPFLTIIHEFMPDALP